MEQISYKSEILRLLLKGPDHIRSIATKLGINHMMIVRKMQELQKENVVDFTQKGKNKEFFIKKNTEARIQVLIAEHYIPLKLLDKYPILRKIIEKLQNKKEIKLAIIFGSYAKGLAKKDSDIDLYVETTDGKLKKELSLLNSKLSVKIGNYNKDSLLIKEIEKNHIIVKGFEEYYEKNQFFK